MTADLSRHSAGSSAPGAGAARVVVAVLGILAVVVGVFLLLHPYSAARVLALLVGLALVLGGCLELAAGWWSDRRWSSVVVGLVLVVGGLLAAFWPSVTLWTIAVITGLSLILHGVGRLALAIAGRREIADWGWLALAGAVNIVIGVLALAWPTATVLVLSLILGIQVLVFGLLVTAFAFAIGRGPAVRS